MDRAELIDQARRAFEEAGRGVVVMLLEDAERRYVPPRSRSSQGCCSESPTPPGSATPSGRPFSPWDRRTA
jgi:hypothetical protein